MNDTRFFETEEDNKDDKKAKVFITYNGVTRGLEFNVNGIEFTDDGMINIDSKDLVMTLVERTPGLLGRAFYDTFTDMGVL